jgi:hypothetical protein
MISYQIMHTLVIDHFPLTNKIGLYFNKVHESTEKYAIRM